jgi:hypothetical protein
MYASIDITLLNCEIGAIKNEMIKSKNKRKNLMLIFSMLETFNTST